MAGEARSWLRQNLAAWASKLDGDSAADRVLVRSRLADMLAEPDFARLREPGELEKLPVEEREEWIVLWKEVSSLVDRTD